MQRHACVCDYPGIHATVVHQSGSGLLQNRFQYETQFRPVYGLDRRPYQHAPAQLRRVPRAYNVDDDGL